MCSLGAVVVKILYILPFALGHGCLNYPNPRGSLQNKSTFIWNHVTDFAPIDWKPHFPAGNKSQTPGSGFASQKNVTGGRGWWMYNPFNKSMAWRADVCGDMISTGEREHRRGGRYFYEGYSVKKYYSGDVLSAGISINAHHNGYMQLHLCDVSKCPGPDISISCFLIPGACIELQRAPNRLCDGGQSKICGPIDRNYPGRWYFPCTRFPGDDFRIERFGYGVSNTILYQIPRGFSCDQCVLQWFWSAAVICNPPGVLEYYRGPDAPKVWGSCFGQGGARGGYSAVQRNCSKTHPPEEYMSCADIRVLPRHFDEPFKYISKDRLESARENGSGVARCIMLLVNGAPFEFLRGRMVVDLTSLKNEWLTVETIPAEGVGTVTFFFDGKETSSSSGPNFYGTGNYVKPWPKLVYNIWINITMLASGESETVSIYLKKR